MGRKYVPIVLNRADRKVYLDDVTFVYKRKIRKADKPLPSF